MESVLTKKQVKVLTKPYIYEGRSATIKAEIRYDDHNGNRKNEFYITGEIRLPNGRDFEERGMIHNHIAKAFPELVPYLKWHGCSSKGPWGYIENTLYFAGNRDRWRRAPGDPYDFMDYVRFGSSPISLPIEKNVRGFLDRYNGEPIEIIEKSHSKDPETYSPNYTFEGLGEDEWYNCAFKSRREAEEWKAAIEARDFTVERIPTRFSRGKEREFDLARSTAIWPDATDEELMADNLKERLEQRLPALMAEFKEAIESLGFIF